MKEPRDFTVDWKIDKLIGKFNSLNNWKIKSIRTYISKRGTKAHVIFEKIDDSD